MKRRKPTHAARRLSVRSSTMLKIFTEAYTKHSTPTMAPATPLCQSAREAAKGTKRMCGMGSHTLPSCVKPVWRPSVT